MKKDEEGIYRYKCNQKRFSTRVYLNLKSIGRTKSVKMPFFYKFPSLKFPNLPTICIDIPQLEHRHIYVAFVLRRNQATWKEFEVVLASSTQP